MYADWYLWIDALLSMCFYSYLNLPRPVPADLCSLRYTPCGNWASHPFYCTIPAVSLTDELVFSLYFCPSCSAWGRWLEYGLPHGLKILLSSKCCMSYILLAEGTKGFLEWDSLHWLNLPLYSSGIQYRLIAYSASCVSHRGGKASLASHCLRKLV